jgi:hypothetical protein
MAGLRPDCKCRQKQGDEVRKDQQLGLDELMIVNPGSSGTEGLFLGEDGALYQLQGLSEEEELQGMGQFFLGEDGTLYQVQGFGQRTAEPSEGSGKGLGENEGGELGRFFLGADGMLYEVSEIAR